MLIQDIAPGTIAAAGQPRLKAAAARRLASGPRCKVSGASTARQPDASATATQAASGGVTAHLHMNTEHRNCIGNLLGQVMLVTSAAAGGLVVCCVAQAMLPLGGCYEGQLQAAFKIWCQWMQAPDQEGMLLPCGTLSRSASAHLDDNLA